MLFALALLTAGLLALIILKMNPGSDFSVGNFAISSLMLFFLAVFACTTALFLFLSNNTRRGIFCGLFVTGILLLRFHHLANALFVALFAGIFLTLELAFVQRKKTRLRRLQDKELT